MGPALKSGFISVKRLGLLQLPLDGVLVHRRAYPQDGTHLYKVKCLA